MEFEHFLLAKFMAMLFLIPNTQADHGTNYIDQKYVTIHSHLLCLMIFKNQNQYNQPCDLN